MRPVVWGDATATDFATIIDYVPLYRILGGSHTYADDSLYTVTVTVTDSTDASCSDFLKVRVLNVPPSLAVTPSSTLVNEGQPVGFDAAFSDPGFDNPLNGTTESFRYYLNWGDGVGTITSQPVADINGGPGVPSTGMFNGSHIYGNDGIYQVTVRLADDDMGAYADATLFINGVAGVDFVEQSFTVAVSAIPEPGTVVLTLFSVAVILAQRRRQRFE